MTNHRFGKLIQGLTSHFKDFLNDEFQFTHDLKGLKSLLDLMEEHFYTSTLSMIIGDHMLYLLEDMKDLEFEVTEALVDLSAKVGFRECDLGKLTYINSAYMQEIDDEAHIVAFIENADCISLSMVFRQTAEDFDRMVTMCSLIEEAQIKHVPVPDPVSKPADASGGVKHDSGKPSPTMLPVTALGLIVEVLSYGARKYSPANWMRVTPHPTRYGDAMLRHVFAWMRGEWYDHESGLPHLAHAATCAMFILESDDRRSPAQVFKDEEDSN